MLSKRKNKELRRFHQYDFTVLHEHAEIKQSNVSTAKLQPRIQRKRYTHCRVYLDPFSVQSLLRILWNLVRIFVLSMLLVRANTFLRACNNTLECRWHFSRSAHRIRMVLLICCSIRFWMGLCSLLRNNNNKHSYVLRWNLYDSCIVCLVRIRGNHWIHYLYNISTRRNLLLQCIDLCGYHLPRMN